MAVDSKSRFVPDLGAEPQQESRPEQIENAVGFLSHPKVRGSPVSSKRDFLKGKGLTEAEIDEAFRRVPEIGQQNQTQNVGDINHAVKSAAAPISQAAAQSPIEATRSGYSWFNVFLGFAFAATTAYSVRKILGPVISRTVGRSSSNSPAPGSEEERKGRKEEKEVSASEELVEAIRSQTVQMRDSIESLKELLHKNEELSVISSSLSELRREVNSIASRFDEDRSLEQPSKTAAGNSRIIGNGGDAAKDLEDSYEPSNPQHPVSYMEVLEMLERGQKPPGIRDDINDKAPNPQVSPPPARLKPLRKPWKRDTSSANGGPYVGDTSGISGGEEEGSNSFTLAATTPEDDAQSLSISTLVRDVGTSASIFESATSPIRHSRSVIVDKLSPQSRKSGKSEGAREDIIPDTMGGPQPSISDVVNSSIASLSNSEGIPDGSGLGRPFSKGWKPPPLPSPSLNH